MAKKGVKFDQFSTTQKVIHVLGWYGAVTIGLGIAAVAITGKSPVQLYNEKKLEPKTP